MSDRQKELRFRVSEAELSQIQENAKTLGMQVHPFVRRVGTEYAVIVEDRALFYAHRDSVSATNRFLDYLEYAIEACAVRRPNMLRDVYQLRDEVYDLLHRLYDCILHHRTKLYRTAQKEAQELIAHIDPSAVPQPNKLADKRPHSIRIKVSPQGEEKIRHFAALHRLPVGVYLRHVALQPHFVQVDYQSFVPYTAVAEKELFRILEIANRIYKRGYDTWYETFFVFKAVGHIAANERKLILEVADRRPKPAMLSEKYPDVTARLRRLYTKFRLDVSRGTLTDLEPSVDRMYDDTPARTYDDTPAQMYDDAPARPQAEPLAAIADTYKADVEDIIRNATERSKRW